MLACFSGFSLGFVLGFYCPLGLAYLYALLSLMGTAGLLKSFIMIITIKISMVTLYTTLLTLYNHQIFDYKNG